jgi:hypothetical protein
LNFTFGDSLALAANQVGGGAGAVPDGKAGADGVFHVCGLPPGDYALTATLGVEPNIKAHGSAPVTVWNRDLTEIRLNAVPVARIAGELVWERAAEQEADATSIKVLLFPLSRGVPVLASTEGANHFTLANVRAGEYLVRISLSSHTYYVKDIVYGSTNILNRALTVGTNGGGGDLRIVLARDGGTLSATVTGDDDAPLQSASVWVLPSSAGTPAELEPALISGATDVNGTYTTPVLAPGKYRVIATTVHYPKNAATVDRLWNARLRGADVEIAKDGSARVRLEPTVIF